MIQGLDDSPDEYALNPRNLHKLDKKEAKRGRIYSDPVPLPNHPKKSFHMSQVKIVDSNIEQNPNMSNHAE